MIITKDITRAYTYTGRIMLLLAIAVFFVIIGACTLYFDASHQQVATWFRSLNSCFYKQSEWSNSFFTPAVKSAGNLYSQLAMVVAGVGAMLCIARLKRSFLLPPRHLSVAFNTSNIIPTLACCITATLLWIWGNKLALPASDEVYSALNVADIHPFQAIAYYMLPNNHVLFNGINNVLFHAATDKVVTGRFISLLAYLGVALAAFTCFNALLKNRWLAMLASITLCTQFQTWGFGFQARGYELYLLAEWALILSLFCHITHENKGWLKLNALATLVGFGCLPSFLYLYGAQLLFMLVYQLAYRRGDIRFWKYQLVALAGTFLFYTPVLCFSGLQAITGNAYVASMGAFKTTGRMAFVQWMLPYFSPYISHLFSDLSFSDHSISLVLVFLPLLLAFCRTNKMLRLAGIFYACMWIVFFTVVIIMKKLPFERNLIGHYSLSLAAVLLMAWWFIDSLARIGRYSLIKWVLFPGITLLFAVHFMRTNSTYLKETLYEYDVNAFYNEKRQWITNIPTGSSIAISEEDFYTYYLCHQFGYKVKKCPTGHETFYIKEAFETIPDSNNYALYKKLYGNEIWKLK